MQKCDIVVFSMLSKRRYCDTVAFLLVEFLSCPCLDIIHNTQPDAVITAGTAMQTCKYSYHLYSFLHDEREA